MSLKLEFAGIIEQAQILKRQQEERSRQKAELARERQRRIALREALRKSLYHLFFLAEKVAANYEDIDALESLVDQFLAVGQKIQGANGEAILERLPGQDTPETAHFLSLRFTLSLLRAGLKKDRQTILDALQVLKGNPQLQAYFRWFGGLADSFCGLERAHPGSTLSFCAELPLPINDCTIEAQQQCAHAVGWEISTPLGRITENKLIARLESDPSELERDANVDAAGEWAQSRTPSPEAPIGPNAILRRHRAPIGQSSIRTNDLPWGVELSDRQMNILEALYLLEAFGLESLQPTDEVVAKAEGMNSNVDSFRKPIRILKQFSLVFTKEGRRGGVWLTSEGRRFIKQICDKKKLGLRVSLVSSPEFS
jgi:hypothetical protein